MDPHSQCGTTYRSTVSDPPGWWPRPPTDPALALRLFLALILPSLTTCFENPAVVCADGRLCAPGTVCSPRGDCVLAEQLDTCRDKPDYMPCSYPRVPDGICARGVCVPAIPVCGDGFVDLRVSAHRDH